VYVCAWLFDAANNPSFEPGITMAFGTWSLKINKSQSERYLQNGTVKYPSGYGL
jgi:hypothetical protein